MHLTSPAAKYCLGNFNFYNIHILPKLLSYIQDSNEIAKVVQFLGASPRPPPGFLPLDPVEEMDVPTSQILFICPPPSPISKYATDNNRGKYRVTFPNYSLATKKPRQDNI